jgi:hypothetical protein
MNSALKSLVMLVSPMRRVRRIWSRARRSCHQAAADDNRVNGGHCAVTKYCVGGGAGRVPDSFAESKDRFQWPT